MFDGHWRSNIEAGLRPIGTSLRRTGLQADHLTAAGIVLAVATAVAIGAGQYRLGLVLLLFTGLCDFLDGALAKASGITSSRRGAFFDSVSDRLTDSLIFAGLAWHFASSRPGLLVMLPLGVMAAASLVSYQRAKAESLGFDARGGLMERAERFIVIGFGLLFNEVLVGVLWLLLVLTAFTAGQRFVKVWRQAERPVPVPLPERRWRQGARRRMARPLSQTWRERAAASRRRRS